MQGRAEAGGTQRTARQKPLMDRHFVAVRRFRVMTSSAQISLLREIRAIFAVFFLFIIIKIKKFRPKPE